MKLRIATYNVENLFRRAAILNLRDTQRIDELLDLMRQLQRLLGQDTYTPELKDNIFELSHQLVLYVDIRRDAGSLGAGRRATEPAFASTEGCKGRGDWIGEIVFKNSKEFSDEQRKNAGKAIKTLDAGHPVRRRSGGHGRAAAFNAQVLAGAKKFKQFVMIDSPNDPRGIDVACLTKHHIAGIRTHVFDDGLEFKPVFSRDCLEVAIDVEGLDQPVFMQSLQEPEWQVRSAVAWKSAAALIEPEALRASSRATT